LRRNGEINHSFCPHIINHDKNLTGKALYSYDAPLSLGLKKKQR